MLTIRKQKMADNKQSIMADVEGQVLILPRKKSSPVGKFPSGTNGFGISYEYRQCLGSRSKGTCREAFEGPANPW